MFVDEQKPGSFVVNSKHWDVLASAKPPERSHFFHTAVLLIPLQPLRFSPKLKLQNCFAAMGAAEKYHHSIERNVSD